MGTHARCKPKRGSDIHCRCPTVGHRHARPTRSRSRRKWPSSTSMDSRAVLGFALRSDEVIRELVSTSRHRCVVFKSLLDGQPMVHLLHRAWHAEPRGELSGRTARWKGVRSLVRSGLRAIGGAPRRHCSVRGGKAAVERRSLSRLCARSIKPLDADSGASSALVSAEQLLLDLDLYQARTSRLVSYERDRRPRTLPRDAVRLRWYLLRLPYNSRDRTTTRPDRPPTRHRPSHSRSFVKRWRSVKRRIGWRIALGWVGAAAPEPKASALQTR